MYNIVITATNTYSPNSTQNFTLVIDQSTTITSANMATFTASMPGTFTVVATGYPTPTFTETGALPAGVTLSSAGVLGGTPAAGTGGLYNIAICACNGIGMSAVQAFELIVDQPPLITSAKSTMFTVGTPGSFTIKALGYPAPTFTEHGTLPPGVTLNATTGVISGNTRQRLCRSLQTPHHGNQRCRRGRESVLNDHSPRFPTDCNSANDHRTVRTGRNLHGPGDPARRPYGFHRPDL